MAIRTFYVRVTFQNKGGGYPLDHEARVKANQMHTAIAKAVKATKKAYGNRFRMAEGATFGIAVTVGAAENSATGEGE